MVAVAIVGAGVVGAGASIYAANSAADAQTSAADQANATQRAQQAQTRSDLQPFQDAGKNALTQQLGMAQTGFNFTPTQSELEATPGYQFNLSQGLRGVQNSASARGLGDSGAAVKGAAGYATGLADSTYQNQFSNALAKYQTNYNNLSSITNTGENAAAQTGVIGQQSATNISNNTIGAGNAQAAAYLSEGNSITNSVNRGLGSYLGAKQYGLV